MVTVIAFGDTHTNSTVGLAAPGCYLDDENEITLSKGQRWLWECWLDFAQKVKKIHAKNPVIALANGDLGEVDRKQRSYQLHSGNKATIKNLAVETLLPVLQEVDQVYFMRGTDAHVGKSAYIEELIAADFTNTAPMDKAKKIYSHWSLLLEVEGIKFDAAHHTNMGNMPWTEKNYGNTLAARTIFDNANNKLPIPDIVIRSHVHRWADSWDAYARPRAIILPAWTLATEFIHRIKPQALAQIGAVIINIDGGKYEVEKIKYEPEGKKYIKPEVKYKQGRTGKGTPGRTAARVAGK